METMNNKDMYCEEKLTESFTEPIKGIIFDLDGVLCFTDRYHYLAWKELADGLGISFDEEKNNQLRGVSRMESLEIILKDYHGAALSMEEKMILADKKNTVYRKLLNQMTPYDIDANTRKTLEHLREKGYALAVGLSSKNAMFIMEKTDLSKYFDAVADGNQIKRSKPDPEVFFTGNREAWCFAKELCGD